MNTHSVFKRIVFGAALFSNDDFFCLMITNNANIHHQNKEEENGINLSDRVIKNLF
jgi:hypothetical protein